jgi:hypothetical protein
MNWLTVVVMWCSVIVGWLLAWIAEEELDAGRKYFEWLRIGLFFCAVAISSYFVFKNFEMFRLVLLLLGIGLGIIHFFLTKFSFWQEMFVELFSFIWATVIIFVFGDISVELGLLFVSILFMYGLVVGTLGKMAYNIREARIKR